VIWNGEKIQQAVIYIGKMKSTKSIDQAMMMDTFVDDSTNDDNIDVDQFDDETGDNVSIDLNVFIEQDKRQLRNVHYQEFLVLWFSSSCYFFFLFSFFFSRIIGQIIELPIEYYLTSFNLHYWGLLARLSVPF
jgi:hypothetical protein